MSRRTYRFVAGFALAAAAAVAGCKDALAPSPIGVTILADPAEAAAVPMTGVNVGNSQCRYTLRASSSGGGIGEVEWLGMRTIVHDAVGTDTIRHAGDLSRTFWQPVSSSEAVADWGWGGPTELLPVTLDELFYFRRRGTAPLDSAGSRFICH